MRSTTQLRVRFADTDAAGIVHYARFLAYLETGRAEAFRQLELAPSPRTFQTGCRAHSSGGATTAEAGHS